MNPIKAKIDALGYLLAGVGLLAMLFLVVPVLMIDSIELGAKLGLVLYLLLGAWLLWWAVRRFIGVGERVVAVMGVVVGWYMLFGLLSMLNTMMAFRF